MFLQNAYLEYPNLEETKKHPKCNFIKISLPLALPLDTWFLVDFKIVISQYWNFFMKFYLFFEGHLSKVVQNWILGLQDKKLQIWFRKLIIWLSFHPLSKWRNLSLITLLVKYISIKVRKVKFCLQVVTRLFVAPEVELFCRITLSCKNISKTISCNVVKINRQVDLVF